jgi:hypothetical protein
VSTLGTERKARTRNLNRKLSRGDDLVAGFISGATVGAVAGGAFTGGSGIVLGAMVGGLVGAASAYGRSHNGRKP